MIEAGIVLILYLYENSCYLSSVFMILPTSFSSDDNIYIGKWLTIILSGISQKIWDDN